MGNEFVQRHRRKSLLALLSLIVKGRAKYVTLALLVAAASLPFVISGETLARFMESPPVAAALRATGLSRFITTIKPGYSSEFVKAAIDKAALDGAQTSYWNRFMSMMGSSLPGQGRVTSPSLALIKGGADLEKFGRYGAGGKLPPGKVIGAVNAGEQARGENGDTVDLAGRADAPGGEPYGGSLGAGLSDRYSGESGPYADRATLSGSGGAQNRGAGMYSSAMKQSGARVPIPGRPQKVGAKKMGKASGFSWKNVGYKTKSNSVDKGIGSKSSLYRLGEAYATTGAADRSGDSAYEYQAAYTGATYDGNDVNLDIVQTDSEAPVLPAGGFTDSLTDVSGLQALAQECTDAQATHGTRMSEDAEEIDRISQANRVPPICWSGGVGAYNQSVAERGRLCEDFNTNQTALANACQSSNTPMDCGVYYRTQRSGGLIEETCRRPSGPRWLFALLMMLLMVIMVAVAVVAGIAAAMIVGVIGMFVINYVQSMIEGMIARAIAAAEALYTQKAAEITDAEAGFRDAAKKDKEQGGP